MRPILIATILAALPVAADTLTDLIDKRRPYLEQIYQDIHAHPELSGEEKRTADKMAAEFRALGFAVLTKVGGQGVVAILRHGDGPTTWVRADMDALPVTEETGLSYASQIPGKMHACGHDFHATALLGTAFVMAKLKNEWTGQLVFLAQPAEELNKGARAMLEDPQLKKVPKPDAILALHTAGQLKKGLLGFTPGFALANVDAVDVTFKGNGTHGAIPEADVDPFIQTAEYILKTQTLLGREKSAVEPAVISVGSVHGGTKRNIIPTEVKIQLTVRSYDTQVRHFLQKRLREVAQGIARTNGAPEPVFNAREQTNATYNDPVLTQHLVAVLRAHLGESTVVDTKPTMAGEDFGLFGAAFHVPLFYFMVGERDEKNPTVTNHSPRFAPDFASTAPLAIRAMATAILALQKEKTKAQMNAPGGGARNARE